MISVTSLVIGIVIGAAIVGIVYGIKKLVSWCSDISFDLSYLKSSNKNTQKQCDDLNEISRCLSEHGTEVLKTFASVHERLIDLETMTGQAQAKDKPKEKSK